MYHSFRRGAQTSLKLRTPKYSTSVGMYSFLVSISFRQNTLRKYLSSRFSKSGYAPVDYYIHMCIIIICLCKVLTKLTIGSFNSRCCHLEKFVVNRNGSSPAQLLYLSLCNISQEQWLQKLRTQCNFSYFLFYTIYAFRLI